MQTVPTSGFKLSRLTTFCGDQGNLWPNRVDRVSSQPGFLYCNCDPSSPNMVTCCVACNFIKGSAPAPQCLHHCRHVAADVSAEDVKVRRPPCPSSCMPSDQVCDGLEKLCGWSFSCVGTI